MTEFNFAALAAAFGTNKEAEADGAWQTYNDKIAVQLRRDTDPRFRKAIRHAYKRFKHMGSSILPEQEDTVKDEAVAKALITDWKVDGVPFSPEAALAAFKQFPDFRRWCEDQAGDVENYKDDLEADKGNSSASSRGSASGEAPTE